MPWLALPYGSDCEDAGKQYEVRGIPNLQLVNSDGTSANKKAIDDI